MATRLIQILAFANVAPAATVNLPHQININGVQKRPDFVAADVAGFTIAVTPTQVSVTNTNAAPMSVNVWLELKHAIPRQLGGALANLTPQPFVSSPGAAGGSPTIIIEDEGVALPGNPFTAINFAGGGVTATDAGGGVADVTIPGGGTVSTLDASVSGDGSGGSPLAARGVFVWDLATTWADIYAQMTAVPGPKICLVEWQYGTFRTMTAGAYDINDIYFMANGIPGGSAEAGITVQDGVTFTARDFGGGQNFAFLLSKNIYWNCVCTTTPIYTSIAGFSPMWIDLDGGGIFSANTVVDGTLSLFLRNRANANSTAGAGLGMFRVRNANNEVYLLSGSELRNRVYFNPDANQIIPVNMDATTRYQDASSGQPSFGANLTVTTTLRLFAQRGNELFQITVDGSGAPVATPI